VVDAENQPMTDKRTMRNVSVRILKTSSYFPRTHINTLYKILKAVLAHAGCQGEINKNIKIVPSHETLALIP
jgi:hypothetical protein